MDKDEEHIAQDDRDKRHRDNMQMTSYAIVFAGMLLCYVIGYYDFSPTYVVLSCAAVFSLWRTRCCRLLEHSLTLERRRLHDKRPQLYDETAEWLNLLVNRWWVFSTDEINNTLRNSINPLLSDIKPAFLDSIEMSNFTLGTQTPFIRNILSYEFSSGTVCNLSPQRRLVKAAATAPSHLKKSQQYDIVIVADTVLYCDEFKMEFIARLGGKWLGKNISIAIEKLNIAGKLQLSINLDKDKCFPHINKISITFIEKLLY